jgi:hypothetical protein
MSNLNLKSSKKFILFSSLKASSAQLEMNKVLIPVLIISAIFLIFLSIVFVDKSHYEDISSEDFDKNGYLMKKEKCGWWKLCIPFCNSTQMKNAKFDKENLGKHLRHFPDNFAPILVEKIKCNSHEVYDYFKYWRITTVSGG